MTDRALRPTMQDVAARAGVSQMTVSRVLRGSGYASEAIRARVLAVAAELGYVHNRLAGGAPDYANPLVGVILPTLQNRVFTEVMAGISETLGREGIRPVFGVTEYLEDEEEMIARDLLSWRPRGLILTGLEHGAAVRALIERTGVRTVEIMDTDGTPMGAAVGLSHRAAGADMARHLIARGHRRFGYAATLGGADLRAAKRFEAFAGVVRAAGGQIVAQRIGEGPSSMPAGRAMTADMLAAGEALDAIYYSNDDLAAGGLLHCLAEGVAVPDGIALAGFNGLGFLDAFPLRLTTTRTPRHRIGAEAARLLAAPPSDGEATVRRLEVELVAGDTA
ncbi:MAG: LacI family DNA-binding transcriptional regulator [Pseudomonadota bacterium]